MTNGSALTKLMVLQVLRARNERLCISRVVGAFGPESPAVRAYNEAEVVGERHDLPGSIFIADAELEAIAASLNAGQAKRGAS